MKVKIRYSFILYIIMLYFFNLISYFFIFFLSILLHELAHGFIGIIHKLKIESIEVSVGGFNIKFKEFNLLLYKKVIILLSGPFVNLILAILVYLVFKEKYLFIIITNIALFLFNIIPIYPLDGGKVLYEILLKYYSFTITSKVLVTVFEIFSIILLFICSYIYVNFYNIQVLFLGIYILSFCRFNNIKNIITI